MIEPLQVRQGCIRSYAREERLREFRPMFPTDIGLSRVDPDESRSRLEGTAIGLRAYEMKIATVRISSSARDYF